MKIIYVLKVQLVGWGGAVTYTYDTLEELKDKINRCVKHYSYSDSNYTVFKIEIAIKKSEV